MNRIGFLGVGHLASAMIAGLVRSGLSPERLILSPRGSSAALAARFGIERATDNAALVEGCVTLVLAVRPRHAAEAITGLPWRNDHLLVSACAGVPLKTLAAVAGPATLMRVMPLTAAEYQASPTAIFPDVAGVRPWLQRLGPVVVLTSEDQFEVATVSAAIYGWAQMLIARSMEWSVDHGLPADTARQLVSATFMAAGRNVAESPAAVADLLDALVTPGGITERGLHVLSDRGVPAAWSAACDAVRDKLAG